MKAVFIAFLIILNCSVCEGATKKKVKYPPYPDVWGYDILDDADTSARYSFTIAALKDGDYAIEYYSTPSKDNKDVDTSVIHFFSGVKRHFATTKKNLEYYHDEKFFDPRTQFVTLSDDKVVDSSSKLLGNYIHSLYVRRTTNDFKKENNEYELSPIGIAPHCEREKGCVNKAYFLAPILFKLKDDTFFAFDPHYYLFIRFDRDFKTKFKSQRTVKLDGNRELKSNFYVLPYSKIAHFFEHVATGYTGKYTDDINRQFLDWLYEEEQRKDGML